MRKSILAVASAVALTATLPESASAGDKALASQLFREGREAMTKKDYATACPKLAESYRLERAAGTLLNLALCEEARGKLATALGHFRGVEAMLTAKDDRVPYAKRQAEALEKRVPRLTLQPGEGLPSGARIRIDGTDLGPGAALVARPVDPGEHRIEVIAKGHEDRSYTVSILEGESREIQLTAGPSLGPSPAEEEARISGRKTRRTVGFVAGGVGVASLGVGIATGILTLGKKSIVDESCGPTSCRTQEGIDAVRAGATLSTTSTVTFVAGAALLGAGLALVLTSLDGGGGEGETRAAVTILPSGVGVFAGRSF